jgi:hypothetical protein
MDGSREGCVEGLEVGAVVRLLVTTVNVEVILGLIKASVIMLDLL